MVHTLGMYSGTALAPSEPTRWDGQYTIDYAVSNIADSRISLLPDDLSDHRWLQLQLPTSVVQQPQRVLQPAARYDAPEHMTPASWRQLIAETWAQNPWSFCGPLTNQSHCNRVWRDFMCKVEECLRTASLSAALACHDTPLVPAQVKSTHKTRPKGSEARVVTVAAHCAKHAEKRLPDIRIRQLRNVLARSREVQRVHLNGCQHPDHETLMRKCRRIVELPDTPVTNQIAFVHSLIANQHVEAKQIRIRTWKHELRTCRRKIYSWLRGSKEPIAVNLHHDGPPAETMQQGLQLLQRYCEHLVT